MGMAGLKKKEVKTRHPRDGRRVQTASEAILRKKKKGGGERRGFRKELGDHKESILTASHNGGHVPAFPKKKERAEDIGVGSERN